MSTDGTSPRPLLAGVAKADITGSPAEQTEDPLYAAVDAARGTDRLYVTALVLRDEATTIALVSVDAVAIAEIGSIDDGYLVNVRTQLGADPGIEAAHVLVNASHCHGVVCADVEARTVQAVREAAAGLEPVHVGVGRGHEDRIMENRRLQLLDGREADVRRAYSLPADEQIASVGPVDPDIGILRLDRTDGRALALVYHFACHPILGVADGGNTADLSGFASRAIETGLGEGATALFLQGCCADINPVRYRDVNDPPDAEAMGERLGLSALRAAREIDCDGDASLHVISEHIDLPREDLTGHIDALEAEQKRLLGSLRPTALNLKSFVSLSVRHSLSARYPADASHRYLHEQSLGRDDLTRLDETNRGLLDQYGDNVQIMEQLTRIQVNLGLLKRHQERYIQAGGRPVAAEVIGLRVGPFALVMFAGELSVQTGLRLKQASPHEYTCVSGVSNGYLYYTPTAEQLRNRGGAQEDSDCFVASEWQGLFEGKALEILGRL
ncbi:MAG TPA: hypothetical protein QGF95_12840 [Candidatus Latescibacteria bacterium]|jgi:hypothetical protein|nr:hypothetical protein [Candidatus Latescibacterota bacterium]HJP31430.1 hypothetical protein [Candidatus Latescibacterota bacterium]